MKWRASTGTSSRRSRSAGTRSGTTAEAVEQVLAEAPGHDLGLRSRLVVAMTRTSTFTRVAPPTRSKPCSCSARTILPWVSSGMSATSSSSRCRHGRAPACRRGHRRRHRPAASTPKSSSSKRAGFSVAQFSATKGSSGAAGAGVDHPRRHFLAVPAGPLISTRLIGRRHALDGVSHLRHGRRDADQLHLRPGAQTQIADLALQLRRFQRALRRSGSAGRT
jgi:hypothetical protein